MSVQGMDGASWLVGLRGYLAVTGTFNLVWETDHACSGPPRRRRTWHETRQSLPGLRAGEPGGFHPRSGPHRPAIAHTHVIQNR